MNTKWKVIRIPSSCYKELGRGSLFCTVLIEMLFEEGLNPSSHAAHLSLKFSEYWEPTNQVKLYVLFRKRFYSSQMSWISYWYWWLAAVPTHWSLTDRAKHFVSFPGRLPIGGDVPTDSSELSCGTWSLLLDWPVHTCSCLRIWCGQTGSQSWKPLQPGTLLGRSTKAAWTDHNPPPMYPWCFQYPDRFISNHVTFFLKHSLSTYWAMASCVIWSSVEHSNRLVSASRMSISVDAQIFKLPLLSERCCSPCAFIKFTTFDSSVPPNVAFSVRRLNRQTTPKAVLEQFERLFAEFFLWNTSRSR